MRFNHIEHILWLPIILVFLFFAFLRYRKIRKNLKAIGKGNILKIVLPGYQPWLILFSGACLFLASLFLILTLVEPQWGTKEEEIKREGIDLLLLVDVSESMMASDIKPTRLEHEKRKLTDLINMLKGDRVGLILFAGHAILQSPLTTDYNTLNLLLEDLDTSKVSIQGTDFKRALELAIRILDSKKRNKAIILLTDGEDHEGSLEPVLMKLKEAGIRLYILGIGTGQGAPIPDPAGGFKKDSSGELVMSQLGEEQLKSMALQTDGAYVRTLTSNLDLEQLYVKGIRQKLAQSEIKSSRKKLWISRYQWPLSIACFLLCLERIGALFVRGWRRL